MAKQAKKAKKMTGLQERFCFEYVIDFHACNAIIRAGTKSKYPDSIATQMLQKPLVLERIDHLKEAAAKRAAISQDKVIGAFAEIGFLDPAEMLDENDNLLSVRSMPLAVRRVIAGFEVEELYEGTGKDRKCVGHLKKLKFCSKNDALDKLAKHLGLFEKDNNQRRQLTIVDIMAIVGVKNGNGDSRTHCSSG